MSSVSALLLRAVQCMLLSCIFLGAGLLVHGSPCLAQPVETSAAVSKLLQSDQSIPPDVLRIIAVTLQAKDADAYDTLLLTLPELSNVSDFEWVSEQLDTLQSLYDTLREQVRPAVDGLTIPPLDSSAVGRTDPILALRMQILRREDNPIHDVVDTIVDDLLQTAGEQLLRSDYSANDWRGFAQLQIDASHLHDAEAALAENVRAVGSAYHSLGDSAKVRVLTALQHHVDELSNDINQLHELGGEAAADAAQLAETIQGLEGAMRLTEHVADLEATAILTVYQTQQIFSRTARSIERTVEQGVNAPQDLDTWVATATNLSVLATAVRAPEPVQKLTQQAAVIANAFQGAQVVVNRAQALAESSETMVGAATAYLNSASAVVGSAGVLAQQFKIPASTIRKAQGAINTAQAALGIATSLASGNIFGAVGAITGLLGGGGPDANELRHQELLQRFDELTEHMDIRFDEVMRGQQEIKAQVAALDRKLDQLAERVVENHGEVMEALGDINTNILLAIELIVEPDKNALRQCGDLLEFFEPGNRSYQAWRSYAQNNHNRIRLCREQLDRLSVDPNDGAALPRLLWMDAHDTNPADGEVFQSYSQRVVTPVVDYLLNTWMPTQYGFNQTMQERARSALAVPSLTLAALSEKLYRLEQEVPSRRVTEAVLRRPLEPSMVVEYAKWVLDLYSLFTFFKPDGTLINEKDFYDPDALPLHANESPGEKLIQRALQVVEYAIAQQALLGGDILLPAFADAYFQPTVSNLAKENVVLSFNIMRYAVYEVAEEKDISRAMYENALIVADPTLMQQLMTRERTRGGTKVQETLPVRKGTDKYEMLIAGRWLPMPNAAEFERREFMASRALQHLISVREALVDVLVGIELVRQLPKAERKTLAVLTLIQ